MKNTLLWVILATKGGYNRARIIKKLHKRPYNNNQLHNDLNLNYMTVNHHLSILKEMNIVECAGKNYGKIYFLTDEMKNHYEEFEEIWEQIKE